MRKASPTDFPVQVEGVGQFTIGRRTMRDEFSIAAEYSRLTEGVETPTRFLAYYARAYSTAKVLMVAAPDGFALELLDPHEETSYATLIALYEAITAQEDTFRRPNGAGGQTGRAGGVQNDSVLVPPQVQPVAP